MRCAEKAHAAGRRLSETIYFQDPAIDGILYPSRLTNEPSMAVYDRAVGKLQASELRPLVDQPNLIPTLRSLNIEVLAS